jgi:hypothetical protein
VWHPIDFANPCPDSQVTSLHFHFPWLVKSYLRWSIFCAATKRKMRAHARLGALLRRRREDLPYAEKLDRYAAIADARFETARFEEFCAKHLGHLDEVASEFFATAEAKEAVRQKVAALFPRTRSSASPSCSGSASRVSRWRKPVSLGSNRNSTVSARPWPASFGGEMFGSSPAGTRTATTSAVAPRAAGCEATLARWGDHGRPARAGLPHRGGRRRGDRALPDDPRAEPLLQAAGRIKIYSPDSVAGRVWFNKEGTPEHRMWMQHQYHEWIRHEVVPAIYMDCKTDGHPHLDGGGVHRGLPRGRGGVPVARRVSQVAVDERHVQPDALHRGRHALRAFRGCRRSTWCRRLRTRFLEATHLDYAWPTCARASWGPDRS